MKTTKKLSLVLLALFLVSAGAYAQGNGMAGINAATKMVTSYFDPGTKLIYAIGAVVGLIGGIKVYNKFSSGDPDTSKTAASWFGACIFLIVAATILRSFFLYLMASWDINKGIGRTVEFKGLKAQYLFLFAGGLLAVFVLVVVCYLCGMSQWLCLGIGLVGATLVVWQTFAMNRKYGQYGLMMQGAIRMHPRYLINRRTVYHLIRDAHIARH